MNWFTFPSHSSRNVSATNLSDTDIRWQEFGIWFVAAMRLVWAGACIFGIELLVDHRQEVNPVVYWGVLLLLAYLVGDVVTSVMVQPIRKMIFGERLCADSDLSVARYAAPSRKKPTERDYQLAAIHEAGHILCAAALQIIGSRRGKR